MFSFIVIKHLAKVPSNNTIHHKIKDKVSFILRPIKALESRNVTRQGLFFKWKEWILNICGPGNEKSSNVCIRTHSFFLHLLKCGLTSHKNCEDEAEKNTSCDN